jgi:ABC-type bacteriocin/lantibiotic exporter with double-glycine peptidase domain
LFGLSSLLLLFAYSTSGGVITIVLTIVLLGGSWLAGLAQIRALTTGEALTANLASMTLQLVQHVVTLRAFGAERRAYVEWVRVATETRRRMLRSRYAIVNYEAGLATFHGLALALVLAFLATGGSGNLSVGGYLAFAAAFQGFLATSEAWGRAIMQIVSAQPVFERTALILETPPEVQPGAKPPGRLEGAVAFSGVAFGYGPDAPPVLTDVTLRVAAGSFAAIVGGSGSGKSTLLSLALGFSRPDRGAVLFDDQDLTGLDVAAVRRQIGVVRQGGRLLGGSLMENIRGMHDCTLDEAWQAAELAGIANDIRAMPMGMHTAVIEGSAGFSGGQVQRLLLARALTGQPRILILDEATSALDNVTQAEVVENISRLGITRIVVAHRLSTIRHADAIHFLHEGEIVESGTFDELMRAGGRFAEFARRQTL